MAGLGVRVRPTGSRSYVYLGPVHGDARGPRKHTLGPATTLSAADARRACLVIQTADQPATQPDPRRAGRSLPFRVFVETEWAPTFRDRYKPSARRSTDVYLRSQLLPAFGAYPLHRISPQDVHRWFDRYSATAPGGANQALRLLRTILRHAVQRGRLESDPTRTVQRNPRPRRTRFLSRDEIRALHQRLDASVAERPSCTPQADIIRLLLFTGCRRSEIVNLRWDEIHGDTLHLRDSKTGPKPVYLNAAAQRVLAQQPRNASPYVFPSARAPERPRSPELCLWYRVRRQAGHPGRAPPRSAPFLREPGRAAGHSDPGCRSAARSSQRLDDISLRACPGSGHRDCRRTHRHSDPNAAAAGFRPTGTSRRSMICGILVHHSALSYSYYYIYYLSVSIRNHIVTGFNPYPDGTCRARHRHHPLVSIRIPKFCSSVKPPRTRVRQTRCSHPVATNSRQSRNRSVSTAPYSRPST